MGEEHKKNVVQDEISLKEVIITIRHFWRYLLARKKIIIIAGITGAALGLTYSFLVPPTYTASTSFVLENTKKGNDYASLAARFGLGGGAGGGLFQEDENIMAFIQSRTMIAKTLCTEGSFGGRQQLLAERYLDYHKYRKAWKKNDRLANLHFTPGTGPRPVLEDSILTFLYKRILSEHLSVSKPDKEEDIIITSTTAQDELFSKVFNEKLMENVIGFYIEGQTRKLQENVDILQRQADSVRGLLNAAITGVAATSEANPNLNPAFQRLRVPTQRRMVDVDMNKAILEELVRNLELARITLRKETPLIQIIDKPVLPLEKNKVGKKKGLIIGGLLAGFATVLFLGIRYYFRRLLAS